MQSDILYERNIHPFGKPWESWAAIWCSWMLSIPKDKNPTLDLTGKHCCINQNDENVWFLAGTFGNIIPVKRRCRIPARKAIFFPVLVKEDSLEEDSDLHTELELITRSRDATNRVVRMEATIDGQKVDALKNYRIQSEVFDLTFPENNVYDVTPGLTRSVCDGYWLFIKPLSIGEHYVYFQGETSLQDVYTITQLKRMDSYSPILQHIKENSTFRLEVLYELTIC